MGDIRPHAQKDHVDLAGKAGQRGDVVEPAPGAGVPGGDDRGAAELAAPDAEEPRPVAFDRLRLAIKGRRKGQEILWEDLVGEPEQASGATPGPVARTPLPRVGATGIPGAR